MEMSNASAVARGSMPPVQIVVCEPARREPGMMIFNVREAVSTGDSRLGRGWLMGLAQSGDLVCLHESELPVQGVRCLASGNLLVTIIDGLVLEKTLGGTVVRCWYATGKYRDSQPPENAIAVEAETFHHGVSLGPDGNMLLLSMEVREFGSWPRSTTDATAPWKPARVVGDIIMEVRPDGQKVSEWRLLDMLDPYRITYGSRDKYWEKRGYPDTNDWCHANGCAYDAKDDCILVSLRTQDCIVKFDRKTGELRWILGSHGNWKSPWSEKLLTPTGPLKWNFHQHDCSITPTGTIMCFDNGNYGASPFERVSTPEETTSRAVEFAVDEAAAKVRQVWSYGEAPGERLFAGFQGGAFRMPGTGNTFITYGGICSIQGKPVGEPDGADICARLVEVTPENDVVLDLHVGGGPGDPKALSVFRSEWGAQ
jgi:arylsulfate sulfotransferase